MSDTNSKSKDVTNDTRTIDAVMKRVSAASRLFELEAIRFIECRFSYGDAQENSDIDVKIGIAEQEVELQDKTLHVSMLFEFLAPSPFKEEEKRVEVRARLTLDYERQPDQGDVDQADADTFGRVNGIYNAWPYLREYVQSSLLRLGLPPFELPLLRAGAAAQLAGFVDPPHEGNEAVEKVE